MPGNPTAKALAKVWTKAMDACRNLVSRGVVNRVDDAPLMQVVQLSLLNEEVQEGAERMQQYGLTSHPQAGAEALAVFVGADRSHPVVLAVDDRRYRITALKPGEVCIYTDEGDSILLGRERTITVTTANLRVKAASSVTVITPKVTVDAPETTLSGHLTVAGGITWGGEANGMGGPARIRDGLTNTGGDIQSNGIILDTHTHTCPDGETSGPH